VIGQLPVYKYKSPVKKDLGQVAVMETVKTPQPTKEDKTAEECNIKLCSICMDEYKDEEEIMILPCLHQVLKSPT